MITCKSCGKENPDTGRFCTECGKSLGVIPKTIVEEEIKIEEEKPKKRTSGETHVYEAPFVQKLKGKAKLVLKSTGAGKDIEYSLDTDKTVIGRESGEISFEDDNFLSGEHAAITRKGNSYYLSDLDSRNGTFIQIIGNHELKNGDTILVGRQLLRFEVE